MTHLNSKPGFTLIEVLLASALVGIVLGPIYFLQSTMFNRVMHVAEAIDRMFVAYDFFLSVKKEPHVKAEQKKVSKTVPTPKTQLSYDIREVPKDSVLQKEFEHLYVEKISWAWSVLGGHYDNVFVHILFEPPKKEPEKETEKPKEKQVEKKEQDKQQTKPEDKNTQKRAEAT